MNFPNQSLTQLKQILKSVLVIFLTVIVLSLLKYNNVANAGGGRLPCSIIEYNYKCFSIESSNYLSAAFINKQQKDPDISNLEKLISNKMMVNLFKKAKKLAKF